MRMRMTVADDATGLRSDVVVECRPDAAVGAVLEAVAQALPVIGAPTVDGVRPDPRAPAARSVLAEGTLLHYGIDPVAAERPDGPVLRVVSGASAGTERALGLGMVVDVGRSSGCGVVLDDPAVSRLHATVRCVADGVEVTDRGSLAGVLVDGLAIAGTHLLRGGEVVQLGGSRLVLELPGRSRLPLVRAPDGGSSVPLAGAPRPVPAPPTVVRLSWPAAPRAVLPGVLGRPRRSREEEHRRAVQEVRVRAERAADDEDAWLRAALPDPATVLRTALDPRPALWSRPAGPVVRLGTADRSASVQVAGTPPPGWEVPVLRRAPVGVDLGAVRSLGIVGCDAWAAARVAWVLAQCAVLHGPDVLPVVVLAPDADERDAGWVRWLPHVRVVAWERAGVGAAALAVEREAARGPVLTVLIGATGSDLRALGRPPGWLLVCTAPDPDRLPERCGAVLVQDGERAELRSEGAPPVALVPDSLPEGAAERIARRLAPLRRAGASGIAPGPRSASELAPTLPPVALPAVAPVPPADGAVRVVPVTWADRPPRRA